MNTFSDTVTPSYVSTGAMKEKLDTLTYSGSGRVITYGYDANQGRLNSLKYSDIDPNNPFTLSYDNAGRMSSITDPNNQSVASYDYGANQGKLSTINYGNGNTANFTWNAKNKITNYAYTDNTGQPPSTKEYQVSYYDDGKPANYNYVQDGWYQYTWKFYYSPFGLDKAEKWYHDTQLIDIDTTVATDGKVLSMTYADYNCQTGSCYSGEASCIYDPCGNLTSLIDGATSSEVWARATDKNTNSTIAIYNPYNMEIPIGGIGMTNPIYDQPINGPIDIYIGENGNWSDHVQIDNTTKLTTYIGGNGVSAATNGDDDCGDQICGYKNNKYDNCMANCMGNHDSEKINTDFNIKNHEYFANYITVKSTVICKMETILLLKELKSC
jgi:YD repeat-containing protein